MTAALTVWLTGLSGSGKSTLAEATAAWLREQGIAHTVLDGDVLRTGLCRDLGFSDADRRENIRRVAEVARLMNRAGTTVICALISPTRADRSMAREIVGPERFVEVHVAASLSACEARDPKGLYKRARAGLVPQFTGIDSVYEEPLEPALRLETAQQPVAQSLAELCLCLQARRAKLLA